MKIRLRQRQLVRQRQAGAPPPASPRGIVASDRSSALGALAAGRTYDDDLAVRCREQWRRGDWDALLALPLDDVERHPQRARLVLMLASAHQARGNHAQTRTLAGLALQWGCDAALVARVMLAGVHNSLGRAATASLSLQDRALPHFAQAVEPGGPRSGRLHALHGRVHEQLSQMQMSAHAGLLLGPGRDAHPGQQDASVVREVQDGLRQQTQRLLDAMTDQNRQVTRLQRHVEQSISKEVGNAVKQLEAHARLQRYLGEGQQVPELHGWPISADFGVLLLDTVERRDYDLILEFGSGASTVLMATAVQRLAPRRAERGRARTALLALEHLAEYREQTIGLLESAGLGDVARVALAPIRQVTMADGRSFPFYDAREIVGDAVRAVGRPARELRVLLMVDGPPSATGPLARYPALPLAWEFLADAQLDILLDDYRRDDEKQVAQRWVDDLKRSGRAPKLTEYPLEKEACLVTA